MAETDVANMAEVNGQQGRTASEVVAESIPEFDIEADARDRAEAAGVRSAAFIDYDEALTAYESRDDVEPLAQRRARENADTFAATDFMRTTGGAGEPGTPEDPEGGDGGDGTGE